MDIEDWRYWPRSPPDPAKWSVVEWVQGDEEGPAEGLPPTGGRTETLLNKEREGWVTIGVWWRPVLF